MAENQHGDMDIKAHEQTFAGFVTFAKWAIILTLVTLIFMALVNA